MRSLGMMGDVVERYNSFAGTRHDFCGFGDVIAFTDFKTIVIQATSRSHAAARKTKLLANEAARAWIANKSREAWVVSWDKKPKRKANGDMSTKKYYHLKVERMTTDGEFVTVEMPE